MSEATAPRVASGTGGRVVLALITVIAAAMTLKYFPGLENEPNYAGAALQTIHPELFAGDPYRGPEFGMGSRILQLSLFYGLVKVFGEIWLDDRFLAVVYFGFVAAGLIGVDKTARLLGADKLYQRSVVLMVFAKDHAFLDHKTLLAHHQGVNHSVIAIPLIVWLFYAALARKGLAIVLALSLVLLATSVRYAPIPILMAMTAVFVTGTRREQIAIGVLSALGIAACYWVLNYAMAIPEAGRLELWDILLAAAGGDVNPFQLAFYDVPDFAVKNGLWLAILGAAIWIAPRGDSAYTGVVTIAWMGILTWLLGGLYLSFAPDTIKFPLLQGIAPTRALAWPQNLAYIAIFTVGFRWLEAQTTAANAAAVGIAFAALFVIGPGNVPLWAGLLAAGTAVVLVLHALCPACPMVGRHPDTPLLEHGTRNAPRVTTQILALVLAAAYAIAVYQKAPAWKITLESGVFGNARPAAWIGVAEHIRETIPNGKAILPIAYAAPAYRCPRSSSTAR